MKNPILLAGPALLLATLVTGCVGYNHTLFMTKSNAGLDLDSKPPTAEVNVSRKEGVVAPTFEGGQTPPVMASFGGSTGGSLSHFFFGVDQTFAGGDAAVAMARLYGGPTDTNNYAIGTIPTPYDSTIKLSKPPKANGKGTSSMRRFFFGLAEPGQVRPLIFGTDTQLGVKVGWTGTGGPYPDTVKIGFNRKEAALAPVTLRTVQSTVVVDGVTQEVSTNSVRMPSFLATISSDVIGSATPSAQPNQGNDLKTGWIQYFATGNAAEQLAQQQAVRKALLARADPGQAVVDRDLAAKTAAAEKAVQTRAQMVEAILKNVTGADGKIDGPKLGALANGISGLEPQGQWVAKFTGKAPGDLKTDLEGINMDGVEPLFKNIK